MKRIILKTIFVLALAPLSLQSIAQNHFDQLIQSGERDIYRRDAVKENEIIPYPYVREADVKYEKKVIRVVDTRQKMNKVITWPKNPLSMHIWEWAIKGQIRAYVNDSLTSFYSAEDVFERPSTTEILEVQNPDNPDDPYDLILDTIITPFDHEKIVKYYVYEVWYFDYKHSVFKPRIMAIAPIFRMKVEGVDLGEFPIYWFRFDDLRPLLAQQEVFNRYNDAARISYDDWFQFRIFDSYILKESNVWDYRVNEFPEFQDNGTAALLESDRIKNELFIFEHDLWQF